ncbi:ABC transporter substrate-binding protein [Marinomonas sp.]|uniref:ABC transporter substrate-binding protein n=1 Tax=Marinomonas sp. TaxID=1904862 RepID=UPI003BAB36B2
MPPSFLLKKTILIALLPMAINSYADTSPIRIGGLATLSGAMTLPESPAAAKAVFDRVNAKGGIQGRKIEYLLQDDKGDAGVTAQAGRELVDSKGVLAFAGSASLQDCAVNAKLYDRRGVLSLPGVAGEFSCYKKEAFGPVSVGPARGTLAALYFASEQLKEKNVCAFLLGIPSHAAGNKWAVAQYEKMTNKKLTLLDATVLPNDDMTPHVLHARSAQCSAIVFSGAEQMDLAWLKAMEMQNLSDITTVFLTPAYTSGFAAAAKDYTGKVYANSEYEPFLGSSPVLDDWRDLMNNENVPLSSFAQGGYISATLLVETMKEIKGPITRDSITKQLRSSIGTKALTNSMMGTPLDMAESADHLSTSATKFLVLNNGEWNSVTPDFIRISTK